VIFFISLLTLFCKHESQKVFFGEWARHKGAIKMLVVFKRKAQFQTTSSFSRCGIKINFWMKKREKVGSSVKVGEHTKQFFTFFLLPQPVFVRTEQYGELLCAPFIKNFNIAEI
jgi:hypothetical protein